MPRRPPKPRPPPRSTNPRRRAPRAPRRETPQPHRVTTEAAVSESVAFNTGLPLAARLREHVLRHLGAEDEWIGQGQDGTGMVWRHSELGTLLELLGVPGGASSVAVLRVTTPVTTVGDAPRAAALCRRHNGAGTL